MQHGECPAERGAMERQNSSRPHPGEKCHDRRGPAAQLAQGNAVATPHGGRTRDTMPREMLHQRDEKRQVLRIDPLFIEGQDEIAVFRCKQEIRVLDPLGDPFAGQHLADLIERSESSELVIGDIGVDRHRRYYTPEHDPACAPEAARIQSAARAGAPGK